MARIGRSITRQITRDASRGSAITEVVWPGVNGVADFEALHSRYNNGRASACVVICLCSMVTAFGRNRFAERKAVLRKILGGTHPKAI